MSDPTLDPDLKAFVPVAPGSDFPIQNLPFGIFSTADTPTPRPGVAIGEDIVDMQVLEATGLLGSRADGAPLLFDGSTLNRFMEAGPRTWRHVRRTLSAMLADSNESLQRSEIREHAIVPRNEARMHVPADIRDYTDFYSSREHATNVGTMFRGPDNALMPNWVHLPVGYHGRSSSIVIDGTPVRRPLGQVKPDDGAPRLAASRLLDIELEMGFFVGPGNELGTSIPVELAEDHIFGMVLVNDWSARDIQKWEYVPLGPFLGKSFATTVSPWIVTLDALAPFRIQRPEQDPEPLPYLRSTGQTAFDIGLEVLLRPTGATDYDRIIQSNTRFLYWDIRQHLAHHTVNGCNARPGDLMASGTISGPDPESYGSLLERTWRGTKPLALSGGRKRTFLEDGDSVVLRAVARGERYNVGFGQAEGTVLPARRNTAES